MRNRYKCIVGRVGAMRSCPLDLARWEQLVNGRKIPTLVLAVWFTCRSSTGSREAQYHRYTPSLRCPRNGQRTNHPILSPSISHWAP